MKDNQRWLPPRIPGETFGRRGSGRMRARPASRRRARPEVLALEDRRLMATVIPVTSAMDTGSGTLRDAFAQAATTSGPVEIDFQIATPATITLTQGQLELTDTNGPVSIVGPGASELTIDGGGASRVLQIDPGVTATISGLTISGGSSDGNGGGLANAGTATLIGVTVSDDVSSAFPSSPYGIPIFNLHPSYADGGGGLDNAPSGRLTLDDCSVSGNSAAYLGGGVLSMGDLTITGSTFQGNTAGLDGGGLEQGVKGSSAELDVEDSTFVGNSASGPGGMESFGTTTVDRSQFENNPGGGMVLGNGTASMTDCTVSGNSAQDGGGVLNGGSLALDGCTFDGNSSSNGGGGVYNTATLTVEGCTISGNHSDGGGAGGGGLSNTNGTMTLLDSIISDNTSSPPLGLYGVAFGGGIGERRGEMTVEGCLIRGNTAGAGGGLIVVDGKATVRDCEISGNVAGTYGGGACIGSGSSSPSRGSASISGCRFAGNTSGEYGGGIAVTAGSLTIANSAVTGNSAADQGGGLFAWDTSYGGASNLTMQGVTVDANAAAQGGGIANDGELTATGVTLGGNSAATGGGLGNAPGATAMITGSSIIDNDATGNGGGIANAGTITLDGTRIRGNTAAADGGGLYNSGITALVGCTVTGNSAASGGGIYAAAGGTVTLTGTRVAGNQKDDIVGSVTFT